MMGDLLENYYKCLDLTFVSSDDIYPTGISEKKNIKYMLL